MNKTRKKIVIAKKKYNKILTIFNNSFKIIED